MEEEFLIHCHGFLSPFKWVLKTLQGDYPTMSVYYHCMKLLLKSLEFIHPVLINIPGYIDSIKLDHVDLNTLAKEVREKLLVDLQENF